MLVRISVAEKGGNERIVVTPAGVPAGTFFESETFSGFLEALQIMSEQLGGPIQHVALANLVLYVKTYGSFTIRLFLDHEERPERVNALFQDLAARVLAVLPDLAPGEVIRGERARELFAAVLAPLVASPALPRPDAQADLPATPMTKIAVVGLANAGKTSILRVFFDDWAPALTRDLEPTKGIEISKKYERYLHDAIALWDFGGQRKLREHHLMRDEPWYGLAHVIFVVDLQDPPAFNLAREYMDDVWAKVREVYGDNGTRLPGLSIFLHKYDAARRTRLQATLHEVLRCFDPYRDRASFRLTSILDGSSNEALVRVLYFSLPDVVIRKILEEGFVEQFEREILPRFAPLVPKQLTARGSLPADVTRELQTAGRLWGKACGFDLQARWFQYLAGNVKPREQPLSQRSVFVEKDKTRLRVEVPIATIEYPFQYQVTLLDGAFRGIAETLRIHPPAVVSEQDTRVVWEFGGATAMSDEA